MPREPQPKGTAQPQVPGGAPRGHRPKAPHPLLYMLLTVLLVLLIGVVTMLTNWRENHSEATPIHLKTLPPVEILR